MYLRQQQRRVFVPVLNVIYEEPQSRRPSLYEQAIFAQFSYWAM